MPGYPGREHSPGGTTMSISFVSILLIISAALPVMLNRLEYTTLSQRLQRSMLGRIRTCPKALEQAGPVCNPWNMPALFLLSLHSLLAFADLRIVSVEYARFLRPG